MTLPWKWEEYCHKSDMFLHHDGTHDSDTHSEEDNTFDVIEHTHCYTCDQPFNTTHHFYGSGMIHDECIGIELPEIKGRKK